MEGVAVIGVGLNPRAESGKFRVDAQHKSSGHRPPHFQIARHRPRSRNRAPSHVRDHQPPRRRQDHAHREAPALRRRHPPRRLGQGAARRSGTRRRDWMELEQERGISVTSSVLQFEYEGYRINLLDTPGHEDFSEDTYRTLDRRRQRGDAARQPARASRTARASSSRSASGGACRSSPSSTSATAPARIRSS